MRVKSEITTNVSTTTTYFVGTHYEVTDGVVTKYYYAGSQRIAMRQNGDLKFIIGDHLGSTSIVTDSTGNVINQTQYTAWGETRYSSGTEQTKYQYTGQYSYAADFGLLFYNARWYDSSLSRFAQADSIMPGGIQGLDRYAYANNAPVKYTDPSGHEPGACQDSAFINGSWVCNPPASSVVPSTPTPSVGGTIGIVCGSQGGGNNPALPGPPCGGGTPNTNQMSVWNSNPYGYPMYYGEYPGDHDVTKATNEDKKNHMYLWSAGTNSDRSTNPYAGKSGAAYWLAEINKNPTAPTTLICYSAGAEACLLYAGTRIDQGLPVQNVVLMGPSFSGTDYNLNPISSYNNGWDAYVNKITSQGGTVLVVADAGNNGTQANGAPGVSYYSSGIPHLDMDDDVGLMNTIFNWIQTGVLPK